MSTLNNQLEVLLAELTEAAPPEMVMLFNEGVAEMMADNPQAEALGVGDTAPDFTLPGSDGAARALSDALKGGPAVVMFFRGGWCPFCKMQLQIMQDAMADFNELRVPVLAISPETQKSRSSTLGDVDLTFPLFEDRGNAVARAFGLAFTLNQKLQDLQNALGVSLSVANGDEAQNLPVPAFYVIGHDRTIRYAHVDSDYRRRAEPAAILKALRETETVR